jgi:hypothetical protein
MPIELVVKEAGYERSSGLVRVALGRLMRKGLVENDGGLFMLVQEQ